MNTRLLGMFTIAASAVALAACSTADETPPPTVTVTRSVTGVSVTPPVGTAPDSTPRPDVTTQAATSVPKGPRGSGGGGRCFDSNSDLAREAIASLGPDGNGGAWIPRRSSSHPVSGGCGLDWMLVNGDGFNDATYTSRVLLFAGGRFLGTVEPRELSYTSIVSDTLHSVTVSYRWIVGDDAFCCPQGGPTTVTASFDGRSITRTGEFPPAR